MARYICSATLTSHSMSGGVKCTARGGGNERGD